jgi:hypothetical protein
MVDDQWFCRWGGGVLGGGCGGWGWWYTYFRFPSRPPLGHDSKNVGRGGGGKGRRGRRKSYVEGSAKFERGEELIERGKRGGRKRKRI